MPNADKDIHFDEGDARAGCYEFGPYRLDARRRQLTRINGSEVEITGKVFDALLYFAQHPGVLIPRSALVTALWPDTVVEDNNLNKLIAALRRALGDAETYIVTVPGRGYQMVADVRVVRESQPKVHTPAPQVIVSMPQEISSEDAPASEGSASAKFAPLSGQTLRKLMLAGLCGAGVASVALIGFFGWRHPPSADRPLGSVVRVISATSYLGDEASPSLSPDGQQFAFSWNGGPEAGEGNQDIYVSTLGTTQPLRLTEDPAVDRSPAWSPDGRLIAFLRRRGPETMDVMVVPSLGGHERKLHTARTRLTVHDREPLLAWSNDTKRLLFTTQPDDAVDGDSYHLLALTLESGQLQQLTSTPGVHDTTPALSPDQGWLAFSRYEIDQRLGRLMLQKLGDDLSPDGAPFPVPGMQPGEPQSPTWSREGKRLVFVNNRGIYEWVFDGDTRLVYALGSVAGTRYGGFSLHLGAESTHAVLSVDAAPADIWALPIDPLTHAATGPAVRHAASSAIDNHPQFSPDGRYFAFVSWRSGRAAVWIADADGTSPRQLTEMEAFLFGFPRWSPNGRELAVHVAIPGKEMQIYLISAENGRARRLASGCCPEWSLDGNDLYVHQVGDLSIARLRMADGRREPLFDGDVARLTADGTRLIYGKVKHAGLFMRSVTGDLKSNPEEKLVDDYVATLGGVAPTGDGFFYVSYTEQGVARGIRFYEYALHAARDVAPLPASTDRGLTVSADGRTLLYSASARESGVDLVKLEFN